MAISRPKEIINISGLKYDNLPLNISVTNQIISLKLYYAIVHKRNVITMDGLFVLGVISFFFWSIYKIIKLSDELDKIKYENAKRHQSADDYYMSKVQEGELQLTAAKHKTDEMLANANREANIILTTANKKKVFVEEFISSKIKDFPIVATAISDYENAIDKSREDVLRNKNHPAIKSADVVKEIRKEKRILIAENKSYRWELAYLKSLLPWLEELEDMSIEPQQTPFNTENINKDEASYWLTPDEYCQLSDVEKYQRALDRYKKRHKSKAEIGREYERYIGYLYEKRGYTVEYFGIEKGLEDLGRDLICSKGDTTYIIQCKCWSNVQGKIIHEKYINQHFGTTLEYFINNVSNASDFFKQESLLFKVVPVFISTVPYSDKAREFAKKLGVICKQEPIGDYPVIKCNINRSTKEKIYHLPFDQQYDKCIIRDKGEFYANTVAEAEAAGFRRAKRWYGDGSNG